MSHQDVSLDLSRADHACPNTHMYIQVYQELDNGAQGVDALFLGLLTLYHIMNSCFKLWKIGVTGKLWHWFRAYLSNREHYVFVEDAKSSLHSIMSSMIQSIIINGAIR